MTGLGPAIHEKGVDPRDTPGMTSEEPIEPARIAL
jgi:hypothetical protein